jgi:hypothetical protein
VDFVIASGISERFQYVMRSPVDPWKLFQFGNYCAKDVLFILGDESVQWSVAAALKILLLIREGPEASHYVDKRRAVTKAL